MTSPLPIIVDSEDRGMKRPVEEVARVMFGDWALETAPKTDAEAQEVNAKTARDGHFDYPDEVSRDAMLRDASLVLDRLVQLGFLNDNYFVAKKAEEAGDEERTNT